MLTNEYDGLNQRIRKDVAGGSSEDRDYYYNHQWQLISEAKDGSAYAIYHWHPFYVDALACRMRSSDTHFFLHDANYNVTAAVEDSTNNVVERYAYSPYGEVTVLDANFSVDSDGLSDIDNQHLYTGRERDAETGLQLNRNRYYHPTLGRWVTRDPVGYQGGGNLYAYVGGMALSYVDPEGFAGFRPNPPPRFPIDPDAVDKYPAKYRERCIAIADAIQNIQEKLKKRLEDLRNNPLDLPGTAPDDDIWPRKSRRGHQRLIDEAKARLAELIAEYQSKCLPRPCPEPVVVPNPTPEPVLPPAFPAPAPRPGGVGGGGGGWGRGGNISVGPRLAPY